jgi:hypothetical protein
MWKKNSYRIAMWAEDGVICKATPSSAHVFSIVMLESV